jgi:hypothetical protein
MGQAKELVSPWSNLPAPGLPCSPCPFLLLCRLFPEAQDRLGFLEGRMPHATVPQRW